MKNRRNIDMKYSSPIHQSIKQSRTSKTNAGVLLEEASRNSNLLRQYDILLEDFALVTGYEIHNYDVLSWGSNVALNIAKIGDVTRSIRSLFKKLFCFARIEHLAEWFDTLRTVPKFKPLMWALDDVFIGTFMKTRWEYLDKLTVKGLIEHRNSL